MKAVIEVNDEVGEVERNCAEVDVCMIRVSSLASMGFGTHLPPPDALQSNDGRHNGYLDNSPRGRGLVSACIGVTSLSLFKVDRRDVCGIDDMLVNFVSGVSSNSVVLGIPYSWSQQ